MMGDIAFVGENLTKGLKHLGVDVVFDKSFKWMELFRHKYGKQVFDIVHVHSPNFKKLGIVWNYIKKDTKLVCHWHGSDLRHPSKCFPVYNLLKYLGDYHLYSTNDLAFWLRKISRDKKFLFICPIDTNRFKPDKDIVKQGSVSFVGGAKSKSVHRVEHDDMPSYLNQFETVNVVNADGLDDTLLSVLSLEAASCDCFVPQLPWLNRKWVRVNADVKVQSLRLLNIYKSLLNNV